MSLCNIDDARKNIFCKRGSFVKVKVLQSISFLLLQPYPTKCTLRLINSAKSWVTTINKHNLGFNEFLSAAWDKSNKRFMGFVTAIGSCGRYIQRLNIQWALNCLLLMKLFWRKGSFKLYFGSMDKTQGRKKSSLKKISQNIWHNWDP